MSKSGHVRLQDARDVFRLIGECREIGRAPTEWRRHLLQGLCRLLDAQVAIGGMLGVRPPSPPEVWDMVDLGWPVTSGDNYWVKYRNEGRMESDPIFIRLCALRGGVVTVVRDRLASDREWYGSIEFNEYRRPSGIDGWLVSFFRRPLPGNGNGHPPGIELGLINLRRPLGAAGFSERDRRMLHLLHLELAPLVGNSLATSHDEPLASLSPRQREVLAGLLEGESEKLVAARLGIGVRTVHEYVTAMYRHFRVHSRAELMARFCRPLLRCRQLALLASTDWMALSGF